MEFQIQFSYSRQRYKMKQTIIYENEADDMRMTQYFMLTPLILLEILLKSGSVLYIA